VRRGVAALVSLPALVALTGLSACASGPEAKPVAATRSAEDAGVPETIAPDAAALAEPEPPPPVYVAPPKIALVLGGGGARGFAHVGVLRVLAEEKIPIDLVVGTSVGSVIGALYAAEPNVFELEWKAFEIEKDDFIDYSLFSAKTGPVKGEAIQAFVREHVKQQNIEEFPVRYVAVATDLATGRRVEFSSGPVVDAVRASVAIPGVFTPAQVGGRALVDGGVVANIAVDTARAHGADLVIASNISHRVVNTDLNDVVDITLQSITIMMAEMAAEQLRDADVVVTPPISDVGTLDFSQKKRCMTAGIESARAQVPAIRKAIEAYYYARGGVPPVNLVPPE